MSSRMSQTDELEEIIYYITEMRRKVNSKMDDFFFIIEQQNKRIHEQNTVIDELAWQLRDLRDSVREINARRDHCACNYENHIPNIKHALRHKLGQNGKLYLNNFTEDQNNNQHPDADNSNNVEDDENHCLPCNQNREQTDDDLYEPIEFKNYTARLNNLKQQDSSSGSSSNTNRGSLKKQLNTENNYDNKMNKMQYSKSSASANDYDRDNGFRKDRKQIREAQSEQYAKPNISMAEEEMNDDVILRRQTVVMSKSNRSSYRESNSGISSIMSDIEEENISDMMGKLKHEARATIYSRQKMRPSSFKTSF